MDSSRNNNHAGNLQGMNYRRLGRTNLRVSVVGFGTCQLRLVPERQAIETLVRGLTMGVNIIHTSPEYEGADKLIAKALRESGVKQKVYVCSQAWGNKDYFERLFESTCEALGTGYLDLFGINCLYDLEMCGENVWGTGGMVEFLHRKKEEGRLGSIFCTTHGPLHHLHDRIKRNVFDAVMVSYNALGFHVLSFNPDTLFRVAQPPPNVTAWEFEDIPGMKDHIFPLLRELDIGLMVMKPFAGGLLSPGKPSLWKTDFSPSMSTIQATDILRYLLMNSEIACVIPGTASVEEATENASAGCGEIALNHETMQRVESLAADLSREFCSRCGDCDNSCGHGLHISWLFRSAYIAMSPYATFGNDDQLQYFALHPQRESTCVHCRDITCHCPRGLNIRANLIALHKKMVDLSRQGLLPQESLKQGSFSARPYSCHVIMKDIPERVQAREKAVARIYVQNTGQKTWHASGAPGRSFVCLAAYVDESLMQIVRLRHDVSPGEKVHFVFEFTAPSEKGPHVLKMDLFEQGVAFFSHHGVPPIEAPLMVEDHSQTREDAPEYAALYIEHNISNRLTAGSRSAFRVKVRNTGTETWYRNPTNGHLTALAVFLDGQVSTIGHLLRERVGPGETAVLCFPFQVPDTPGRYTLKIDLMVQNITMFEDCGLAPVLIDLEVLPGNRTRSEHVWEKAKEINYWFFSPGLGVHRSHDEPTFPLFAGSAKGSRITDVEGKEFIDLIMGWGCALLGYAHDRIQKAIARELSSGAIITLTHPLEIEVSEKLCEMIPSTEMVLFGKNGSDTCTAAVRMARAYTQRHRVLVCGYHGWQDWYAEQHGFRATGVPERADGLVIPFTYHDVEGLKHLLRSHSGNVAAVMIDPSAPLMNLNGPFPEADAVFLAAVAGLTREAGALLIFDEVLSGFRFRQGSVQKAFGVTPDLTCLGKALSAGMPLSALVGKREVFKQTLHRIYYTPTFKGEVYSFAAAKEALTIYQEEDISGHVWRFGEALQARLNQACQASGLPCRVAGPPFRMVFAFDEPDYERRVMMRTLLVQELTRHRVLTWKGLMVPSYAHNEQDLEQIVEAAERALPVLYDAWKHDDFLRHLEIPDDP